MSLIKKQEFISLLATIYATFLLGNSGIYNNGYIYAIAGAVFSVFMYRVVFDRLKAGQYRGMVIMMSIPFVASWIFLAPTLYSWYLGMSGRVNVQTVYDEVQKYQIQINKYESKIDKLDNIYIDFKLSKSKFIEAQKADLTALREEWKGLGWAKKKSSKYQEYINRYKNYELGAGATAIDRMATLIYQDKLSELNPRKVKQGLKAKISSLKAKIRGLNSKLKLPIPMYLFYIIMGFIGVTIELLITHVDFWFQPKINHQKIYFDNTMDLEFLANPQLLMDALGVGSSWELNSLYAMFLAHADGFNSLQQVKRYSQFINPATKKPYKINKNYYNVRRTFIEKGGDLSLGISRNLEVIKECLS